MPSLFLERADKLAKIRSDSALPLPQPDSCPPTPTRLAGTGTAFEFEDRGDLIKFYNTIFVKRIKNFATKFSNVSAKEVVSLLSFQCQNYLLYLIFYFFLIPQSDAPPLAALPALRSHPLSPRRVSNKHSVYVSPHKMWNQNNNHTPGAGAAMTPRSRLLYCFNKSPAQVKPAYTFFLSFIFNMFCYKSCVCFMTIL